MSVRTGAAVVVLAALFVAVDARADDADDATGGAKDVASARPRKPGTSIDADAEWSWPYRRFNGLDGAIVAGAAAGGLALLLVPVVPARWPRGTTGYDESLRDALRIPGYHQRRVARDISDLTLTMSLALPLLADDIGALLYKKRSHEFAREMFLLDLETLIVTAGVTGMVSSIVSRERPYADTCGGELPKSDVECRDEYAYRYRSFFSGHTSMSFAGAALSCGHHARFELWGPPLDLLSCVGAMGLATATGALRVLSDQHYVTDVVVGAAVGSALGFALPPLLRYRTFRDDQAATVRFAPTGLGGAVYGVF